MSVTIVRFRTVQTGNYPALLDRLRAGRRAISAGRRTAPGFVMDAESALGKR